MKKVEGIIRPHFLEAVKVALQEAGVAGMMVRIRTEEHGEAAL